MMIHVALMCFPRCKTSELPLVPRNGLEKRSTKIDAVKQRFAAADSLTSLQKQLPAAYQHAMYPQDDPMDPQILV